MRFALIGPVHPYRGGIAHYTTLLANHLAECHEVSVISFRRQYPSWLFPGRSDRDPSEKPLTVCDARYILDPFWPLSWVHTARSLREFRPDALLIQWWVTFWAPSFAAVLRLHRHALPESPVISFCHNVMPHESRFWDHYLAQRVLSLPHYHLVHSTQDRQRLLDLVPDADVSVIQFPPYEGIASVQCTKAEARDMLGLDQDVPVLLFFGFVRPYKGLMYLLRAAGEVRRHTPVHLLIVGEFWRDKPEYLRAIDDLGLASCVTIVDEYVPNEELGKYFGAANVLILPYTQTSQSAVLQVAFATGTPVIASDTGGLRESLVDGVNGLLVRPGDTDSLAAAILRYLQEGVEARLRKNILEGRGSTWDAIVSRIETLASMHSRRRQGQT